MKTSARFRCGCIWVLGVTLAASGCFGEGIMSSDRAGAGGPGGPSLGPGGLPEEDPVVTEAEFVPGPLALRRLLKWQYANAVGDLLGAQAAAAVAPPDDIAINGFEAIGASQFAIASEDALAKYEASAFAAAKAALARSDKATFIGCTPKSATDAACLNDFIQRFGKLAFRRPLDSEEVALIAAPATAAATKLGTFDAAIEFAIATILQMPDFIYLVERGSEDPAYPGLRRLSAYELAARMAFFLTGSTPSAALLAAAEAGELDTIEGIRTQARNLLKAPKARQTMQSFFDEYFELRSLEALSKDPALFPAFKPSLQQAMHKETSLFFENLIWEANGDFRQAFNADYTYVNAELAALYGLPSPGGTSFARVQLPAGSARAGVLGHASFLAVNSHVNASSPTIRGKFVRLSALCQGIPPPPANVSTVFPDDPNAKTARERLAVHQTDPACSGCHRLTDPLGLALENFDAVGRYRNTENGATIDPQSTDPLLGTFAGANGLGAALAKEPSVASCFTRNLFRVATGHVDTVGEQPSLQKVDALVAAAGYRTQDALVELVGSAAFRYGRIEE